MSELRTLWTFGLLILVASGGALGALGVSAPHAASPVPAAPAPSGAPAPLAVAPSIHVHPSTLTKCNPMIPWPAAAALGDGFWLMPLGSSETGCPLYANQDEVHASFLSSVAGSGDRFTEEIHLPANQSQVDSYGGVYLGMVVSGNSLSQWNESYFELSFIPLNNTAAKGGYEMTVAIYSLVNGTGPLSGGNPTDICPGTSVDLTWNASYYCEEVDWSNHVGEIMNPTIIVDNSWFNITFAGVPKTTPVTIWANDSTDSSESFQMTLDQATTGTFAFTPTYSAACETCTLQWGMGYGNGIGVGICPGITSGDPSCNSYNVYPWFYNPPVEYGIPQFYSSGAYTSDFQYLGFESASGDCSIVPGATNNPIIAYCIGQFSGSGNGFYPYFTFNGTRMDFGSSYPWTTWDFGGPTVQYNVGGTMTAKVPFALDSVQDSSRGGYVLSNQPFNVSARLQVVGHLHNASLLYRLGTSGSWTSTPMTQTNGSTSIGYFNATVPGTGGDGIVSYWAYGLDQAGLSTTSSIATVSRGPLPVFNISVSTLPSFCGAVIINGTSYANGVVAHLYPGTYTLSNRGCYPYVNPVYTPSHLLQVRNGATALVVRGSGSITLSFTFLPPNLNIQIAVDPNTCPGSVSIGGTGYGNGATAVVVWNTSNTLTASPCANNVFAGFTGSNQVNVTITTSGMTLVATGNGTLTVHFVSTVSAIPILFLTWPANCGGGINFNGAVYENDTTISVAAGTYPILGAPCAKYGFLKWKLSGGASTSDAITTDANNLTISSQATIFEVNYHLTIISISTNPSFCGTVQIDGRNYSNGQSVVVANNSTHSFFIFACTNYTLLGLTTDGGLNLLGNQLTANGSGTVYASFTQGSLPVFVGFQTVPPYCGSIGFLGQTFYDTNYTFVQPGTVANLTATPCQNYGFLDWQTAGGITIVGNTAYINSSGAIIAVFSGLVNIYLFTSPPGCGSIVLGGTAYPGNSTPDFPSGIVLSLSTIPCTGWEFSYWVNSPGAQLSSGGTVVQIVDPSQLEAVFVRTTFSVTVVVTPSSCGSVLLNNTPAFNGSTLHLVEGIYPIVARPCTGDDVIGFTEAGNVSVVGSNLYVNGSGSVTVLFEPVPPIVTLDVPSSAAAGLAVSMAASIAVPIPPYNYTYNWTFGDGAALTTTSSFADHSYSSPGSYRVVVQVTDPLGRQASANATVHVTSVAGTAAISNLVPALGALALAVVVIAAAFFLAGRRSSGPREPVEPSTSYRGPAATPEPSGSEEPLAAEGEPFPKEP